MRQSPCRNIFPSYIPVQRRNVILSLEEVSISSGVSDEFSDILDLFEPKSPALVIEPAYPAYADANIM